MLQTHFENGPPALRKIDKQNTLRCIYEYLNFAPKIGKTFYGVELHPKHDVSEHDFRRGGFLSLKHKFYSYKTARGTLHSVHLSDWIISIIEQRSELLKPYAPRFLFCSDKGARLKNYNALKYYLA